MKMLLTLLWCVAAAGRSLRGGVDEEGPFGLVVFTAAIGEKYEKIAKDWCRAVSEHVVSQLPFKALALVLTTTSDKLGGCATHPVSLSLDENESDAMKSLRIKTLKMIRLPYESRVYMWLDVDIRPVAEHAPWFRELITKIVLSQTSDSPILPKNAIALTRTRRDVKYNGGLFLYADHSCVDMWKQELHNTSATTNGRDQPALYQVTTRTSSPRCTVVDLPQKTQGYFTAWHAVDAVLGRRAQAFDHALVHFTGNFHSSDFWLRYLN